MSNEIELYSKMQNPLEAIDRLGEMFAKSGMFGCEKVEQGKVLAVICMAEKKSPVAITRDYDIVEGKLRKKALAALADFRSIGGKHEWLSSGDVSNPNEELWFAELKLTLDGIAIVYRYSMADARKEGLIKDKSRWAKRPGNMLRARCISNGVAMLCPEIFAGDDSDSEPVERPEILPQNEKEKTIEAEVVSSTVAAASPMATQASEPTSSQPINSDANVVQSPAVSTNSKAFGPQDVRINPNNPNLLSDETCVALVALFGNGSTTACLEWIKNKKWITDDLAQLSIERARRILSKPVEFMAAVKGLAK